MHRKNYSAITLCKYLVMQYDDEGGEDRGAQKSYTIFQSSFYTPCRVEIGNKGQV